MSDGLASRLPPQAAAHIHNIHVNMIKLNKEKSFDFFILSSSGGFLFLSTYFVKKQNRIDFAFTVCFYALFRLLFLFMFPNEFMNPFKLEFTNSHVGEEENNRQNHKQESRIEHLV